MTSMTPERIAELREQLQNARSPRTEAPFGVELSFRSHEAANIARNAEDVIDEALDEIERLKKWLQAAIHRLRSYEEERDVQDLLEVLNGKEPESNTDA